MYVGPAVHSSAVSGEQRGCPFFVSPFNNRGLLLLLLLMLLLLLLLLLLLYDTTLLLCCYDTYHMESIFPLCVPGDFPTQDQMDVEDHQKSHRRSERVSRVQGRCLKQ